MSGTKTNTNDTYELRKTPLLIVGLLLIVVSICIVFYWDQNKPVKQSRPQHVTLPLVSIAPVIRSQNAVTITANGFVAPKYTAQIRPQVSGKIIFVSPQLLAGELINKGDTLVQLDATDYKAAVAMAHNNLANAQSQYQQEQGRSRQAQWDIKKLKLKTTPLNLRKPQMAAAKAAVDNAQAQLILAQENIRRTKITAPFDAIVQTAQVSLGEIVGPGISIAQLANTDTYTVKINVTSDEFRFLSRGNQVILSDKRNLSNIRSVISRFDAGFNKNNRSIGVYIDIKKPLSIKKPLLLESFLNANIIGKTFDDSTWVNNYSIIDNTLVWKKNDDDTIEPANVDVIHRGKEKSLVIFDKTINNIILRPQNSFYAKQKVTTNKNNHSKKQPSSKKSHEN